MIKNKEMQKCDNCGKDLVLNDYYNTTNKFSKNGKINICKKCIKKMVDYDDIETIYDALRQMNTPFLYDYWQSAISSPQDTFGAYMRMANSTRQLKGLTWKDSNFGNKSNNKIGNSNKNLNIANSQTLNDITKTSKKPNFVITEEIFERWGSEKKEDEYIKLEQFYRKMKEANEIETPQDEFYLKKLSMISMKMDEELENGNYGQVKQLGDLFSKYMADSQFRAMDKTDADKLGGIRNFSTIFSEVEKDGHIPPWEYYRKIKGLTQDTLDKTIMHIENFTLKLNRVEQMTEPPTDTPKVDPDEIDLDHPIGDDDE